MTGHFEETHIANLDLLSMGVSVIPVSGKKIIWQEFSGKIPAADGKIVSEEPQGESGRMEAVLAFLLG